MAFTVQTNRTDYEYDIHSLVKAFYPQESVNVLTPDTGESKRKELLEDLRMEVLLFRNGEGSDGAKIAFFSEDGKKTVHSFAYTGDEEDEKEFKKATKRFLYEVLTEETGRSLPWGNLTGIRPTKIAMTKLAEGETEGMFTSAVYTVADFYKMVASWNAAIYDGTSVEVYARAYTNDAWSEWFSWGEYGMSILRGCNDGASVDEYIPGGTITKAQFRAVLRRDSASLQSPVLRQITFSIKGGDTVPAYAETPVSQLPVSKFNASPAYSQLIRDPEIGGSICSPSTISAGTPGSLATPITCSVAQVLDSSTTSTNFSPGALQSGHLSGRTSDSTISPQTVHLHFFILKSSSSEVCLSA